MLRLVEEVTLLLRRDEDLAFTHVPTLSLRYGLAGSVLMDLAIENRIDSDLECRAVFEAIEDSQVAMAASMMHQVV